MVLFINSESSDFHVFERKQQKKGSYVVELSCAVLTNKAAAMTLLTSTSELRSISGSCEKRMQGNVVSRRQCLKPRWAVPLFIIYWRENLTFISGLNSYFFSFLLWTLNEWTNKQTNVLKICPLNVGLVSTVCFSLAKTLLVSTDHKISLLSRWPFTFYFKSPCFFTICVFITYTVLLTFHSHFIFIKFPHKWVFSEGALNWTLFLQKQSNLPTTS